MFVRVTDRATSRARNCGSGCVRSACTSALPFRCALPLAAVASEFDILRICYAGVGVRRDYLLPYCLGAAAEEEKPPRYAVHYLLQRVDARYAALYAPVFDATLDLDPAVTPPECAIIGV